MTTFLLTPDELRELTGARRSDAQGRALDFMGIMYCERPDGTLAVLRSVVERRLGWNVSPRAETRPEPQIQP